MMIELKSLTYQYRRGIPIFENYDLSISRGEAWAVIGPSGCGKSTLLYLLAGLRLPLAGQVLVDGQNLTRPRPHTGFIIQDYGLLPWATVRQNIELGLKIRDFYGPDGTHAPTQIIDPHEVDRWINHLGLDQIQQQYPGQISGGQRQRTAIARTLVLSPDLLLMDEPFSSLDAPTREELQQLTLGLRNTQNLTLVIVTHAIEEAAVLGEKILVLGQLPNRKAEIINNPGAAKPNFRETETYQDVCKDLRGRIKAL